MTVKKDVEKDGIEIEVCKECQNYKRPKCVLLNMFVARKHDACDNFKRRK